VIKKQIPNLLTLFNLFMGCCALYFVYSQQYQVVLYLILAAAIADVLDGLAARWLQVAGGLGKELDSLADVVSFGVVPGAILFQLIQYSFESRAGFGTGEISKLVMGFAGYLFTLGAALRLARFNIDTRQSTEFIGLATPGATVAILGLMAIHIKGPGWGFDFLMNEYFLVSLSVLMFLLMNSPIRMFSLKTLQKGLRGNEIIFVFILVSILALLFFRAWAMFLLPFVYVILSLIIYHRT
jgi:CDP-diacylglycerol---serine O-phosphatidyltransferase